jgi:hypothetical protein
MEKGPSLKGRVRTGGPGRQLVAALRSWVTPELRDVSLGSRENYIIRSVGQGRRTPSPRRRRHREMPKRRTVLSHPNRARQPTSVETLLGKQELLRARGIRVRG